MSWRSFTTAWGGSFQSGVLCGAGLAALAATMVLAGLGAVCLATILGASTALTAALGLVLVGALSGALSAGLRAQTSASDGDSPSPPGVL